MTVTSVRSTNTPAAHPAPATVKLPSARTLQNVMAAWAFHGPNHQLKWSSKRPAGAVLKDITVQAAPKRPMTGNSIVAHVLKSDPTQVYFEKGGSSAPYFFGPVSWQSVPR